MRRFAWLWLAVAAALCAGCGVGATGDGSSGEAASAVPGSPAAATLAEEVAADGDTASAAGEPTSTASAAPPAPGLLARVNAACGDRLAAQDRAFLVASGPRNTAELRYAQAEARVRGVDRQLRRAKREVRQARAAGKPAFDAFDAFLHAHPEHYLLSGDYGTYQTLRARALAADAVVDRAVDAYNALVDRHNAGAREARAAAGRADAKARQAVAADDRWVARAERCLARIDAWDETVEALERRLDDAARPIATATAQCDSPAVWADAVAARNDHPGFDLAGYVMEGSNELHLSPRTCLGLARVVASPTTLRCVVRDRRVEWRCPPSKTQAAWALMTLAHEAIHASGVFDEARTECYALQRADEVARRLGVGRAVATKVGPFTHRRTEQPKEYRTTQCRKGTRLDLEPETPRFP